MNYEQLMSMPPRVTRQAYEFRDTILYALGVGEGIEPGSLDHVYEKRLEPLATMAVVLAAPTMWYAEPQFGIDWKRLLHAEHSLTIHKPLQPAGRVASELKVDELLDKGPAGALLRYSRRIYDEPSGDTLATVQQSMMLRGHGGFRERKDPSPPRPAMPQRSPDVVTDLPTRPEQALIYRLSGDYNPLHCDPQVATAAGFPRPILHGLCTYGIAGRALIRAIRSRGPGRITRMDARFTSPVFPGETVRTELWWEGRSIAFRCLVVERANVVIDNGIAEYS